MTPDEWKTCADPHAMLKFVQRNGNLSERKGRLFAVGCCRRIWFLLTDERSRRAVDVAESHAEGLIKEEEREQAIYDAAEAFVVCGAVADVVATEPLQRAVDWFHDRDEARRMKQAYDAAHQSALQSRTVANGAQSSECASFASYSAIARHGLAADEATRLLMCQFAAEGTAFAVAFLTDADPHQGDPGEVAAQCGLLRDLFEPFRTESLDPGLRTSNVVALARAIYERAAFERLAELATLVADAGCADAELLDHLRGPGPHARGCWALDLLLGRE